MQRDAQFSFDLDKYTWVLIEFFIKNDKKAYHDHVDNTLFKTKRHYSCESSLIGLVEDWKRAKDNKLSVSIISTDM